MNNILGYIIGTCLLISIILNVGQFYSRPNDFIAPARIVVDLKTDTVQLPPIKTKPIIVRDTIPGEPIIVVHEHKEYPLDEPFKTFLSVYTKNDSLIGSYPIRGKFATIFRNEPYEDFIRTTLVVEPLKISIPAQKIIEYQNRLKLWMMPQIGIAKEFSAGILFGYDRFCLGGQMLFINGESIPLLTTGWMFK